MEKPTFKIGDFLVQTYINGLGALKSMRVTHRETGISTSKEVIGRASEYKLKTELMNECIGKIIDETKGKEDSVKV